MISHIEKISAPNETKSKNNRLIYCKRKRSKKLSFDEILLKINNDNEEEQSSSGQNMKSEEENNCEEVQFIDNNRGSRSGVIFDEFI